MKQPTTRQPDFKKEGVLTLGELLQDIVEATGRYYSLFEFLEEENSLWRKNIKEKLVNANQKQFEEFMDSYEFVNEDEVHMACQVYFEATVNRAISMGEMGEMDDMADDYIRQRGLEFDDTEHVLILKKN